MTPAAYLTLSELNRQVRSALDEWSNRTGEILVVAELADWRRGPTGRYYCRLVERTADGIIAELGAVLWQRASRTISAFREVTGKEIAAGMEVLIRGRVTFHERYGLKFEIAAVDPTYSLGEMQRLRREAIDRLTREGLIDRNGQLPMPLVPARVAAITSVQSAGYQDFVDQLARNPYGYVFTVTPFPALMQGDEAPQSIARALGKLARTADQYDIAVLIRGGGSQVDLSCFDTYEVGAAIASCRVPLISGVGHERDHTVADLAAHTRAKTPTAVAETIIAVVRSYDERLEDAWERIERTATRIMVMQGPELTRLSERLRKGAGSLGGAGITELRQTTNRLAVHVGDRLRYTRDWIATLSRRIVGPSSRIMTAHDGGLSGLTGRLTSSGYLEMQRSVYRLEGMEKQLKALDPARVLQRGFSVTRYAGHVLYSAEQAPEGGVIVSELAGGVLYSRRLGEGEVANAKGNADVCSGDRTP
ncbi:MAG: exodeoxyribonuclease VII large subunit [Chthonomonadales bacterium]|nr:exodeoxyribonuclease VII large subunit [Chthonomonadales bacterium]